MKYRAGQEIALYADGRHVGDAKVVADGDECRCLYLKLDPSSAVSPHVVWERSSDCVVHQSSRLGGS